MTQELNVLFPAKEITISTGEVIKIAPFTFGQLPQALKLASKIGNLLGTLVKDGKLADKSKMATSIMFLISEGGEDLLNLLGLGINKDRAWFDTLQGDDGITLTVAFLEVNLDFFTKKMLPQMISAMNTLKPADR